MPLMPKRVKYRKYHRGRRKGNATRGNAVNFGEFGIKSIGRGWMTNIQIEAARIALTRHMKRGGKVWIRVFPDKSITKKPAEVRMGKGKGAPEGWVATIKPGTIIFEIGGIQEEVAKEALRLCAHKLPFPTKFVTRGD